MRHPNTLWHLEAKVGNGETITNLKTSMTLIMQRLFTPNHGGPSQGQHCEESLLQVKNNITIFVADAASNEQGAGRCSQQATYQD